MGKLLNKFLTYNQLNELILSGESVTQNENGFNALHATTLMTVDMQKKIKLLVEKGVDVNAKDNTTPYQNTPLHILIVNEDREDALYLLQTAGHKINYAVTDSEKKTSLITAAKINASDVASEIIRQIGDDSSVLNAQDNQGMTALHYACLYGSEELAQLLLSKGAAVDLKNSEGRTPIYCLGSDSRKINQTLESISINPDRDENSFRNEFVDKLSQPIIEYNVVAKAANPIEITAKKDNVPLLLKALNGSCLDSLGLFNHQIILMSDAEKNQIRTKVNTFTGISLLEKLTEQSASLKINLLNKGYHSAWLLRNEAANGNEKTVALLIKNGPQSVQEMGLPSKRTALQQAATKGHQSVCKLLVDAGAHLNVADKDGNTALHLAINNKHYDLAKFLVSCGADIGIKNKSGDNILSLLTRFGENQLKQEFIQIFENSSMKQTETLMSNFSL